ncbi:MAG: L-arabinose ABC transporter ATP-binding protein AraG [Sphaerochaeta sp.]|nr:L-arabinose ABC transporter ATP-binding protein AraG [Sphaerochaeta sp.]
MKPVLEFNSITKTFPGVKALDAVSFSIQNGQVHGLIGENGSGKSTLLKILSGAYHANEGHVLLRGEIQDFKTTSASIKAGIASIYQELNLVPEMTVAENLMLGQYPTKGFGFIDFKKLYGAATKQLDAVLDGVDPKQKVKNLSIGQRQMVEIAKALLQEADIIGFDEPTSSLSDKEVHKLFEIIKNLRDQGKAIIYVTHRMEEIFEICDQVTVFRDGQRIVTYTDMKDVTHDLLVSKMVGRNIDNMYSYRKRPIGETVLKVEELSGAKIINPVSFDLKRGEILGFFGLVGAGRTEVMRLLYGADKKKSGEVTLDGKELKIRKPKDAIEEGLVLMPEDRKYDGIIPIRSVNENINISCRRLHTKAVIFIDDLWEAENAKKFVNALSIKTPSINQKVGNLSGGNQQKVILARWLSEDISVLIMDEPTRGIDVGTKNEIYNLMYNLSDAGKSIICISSDLPEIMGVSDRLLVMRDGAIVGSLTRDQMNEETIIKMALTSSYPTNSADNR